MTLYRTSDQSVVWQKSIPSYYSVHISDDTRYLFLIEDTLHIFDTTTGALLHNLALPFDNIYKLILSPDHSTIACSNFDGEVALIKPGKNPSVLTKKLSDSAFLGVSTLLSDFGTYNYQAHLSESGKYLVTHSQKAQTLELWDLTNKNQLPSIDYGLPPIVWSQFYHETFYYLTENGMLTALNIETGKTTSLLLDIDLTYCIFKEEGGTLLIIDTSSYIAINLESLKIPLKGQENGIINDVTLIGDAYNLDAPIATHQFMASDQSVLLISKYNNAIKLDAATYTPLLEIPFFGATDKAGTVVLVPNSQYNHKGELLLYPYYTTDLTLHKGNNFLENKYLDPIKKKSYCLQ